MAVRPGDRYLSPEGYQKLKDEWKDLKFNQRPEMQRQVHDAAAEGDRSENAAYTYGRMRLREIDRRLKELDRLLDKSVVVNAVIKDGSIRFGAQVTLKNLKTEKEVKYTMVGSSEVDAVNGKISLTSPIGKLLLAKRAGERILLNSPRGEIPFEILEVSYRDL